MRPDTRSNLWILLAAAAAGGLGLFAGYAFEARPSWLINSEPGQRVVQGMLNGGVETPDGLLVAGRGDPLPEISLPDREGTIQHLRDPAGRPQLINFWASWCGPCIEEMPVLDAFATQQGADGVQVVGIALDDADSVAAFLQATPVNYRILLDSPGARDSSVQLGNARGVLPYTVLVDANGEISRIRVGPFAEGEVDTWAESGD